MKNEGNQIFWFIGLVLAQVCLFNHVNLAYLINPFVYVYLLLVFPNQQNRTLSLLMAFLLGLAVDALSNTWGIHTVATTLVGYLQPMLLKLVAKPEQLDKPRPSLYYMKGDFYTYAIILVFLHHFLLFMLEAFDFRMILWVLLKSVVSTLLTLLFVYVFESIRKQR